jgi:ATP-dependent protease ClpP protease subunit
MKKIILEGVFGWDIYSLKTRRELDEAKGEDLDVHIASPGGSVFEGIKVYNLFRDYKREYPNSQNILSVKGVAASMASYFAMNPAFEIVAVEDNATFMMHNPTGGFFGDYRSAEKFIETIKGFTSIMALAYSQKTGKSKKEIKKMMDDETWFFGEKIVEAGFADEIIKTSESKNEAEAIAIHKLEFQNLNKKLQQAEFKKEELYEIAALFVPDAEKNKTEPNPAAKTRENNTKEIKAMTLQEFLDSNPAAKIEYEKKQTERFNAGKTEGIKEVQDRIEKASKFIGNSAYPKQINDIAISVIKGEKSLESLDTVISTVDMFKELGNSNAATTEQAPDTPAGDNAGMQLSKEYLEDGTIMNAADMAAEENRINQING